MNKVGETTNNCPLCKKYNNCGKSDSCWCSKENFPDGIFKQISMHQLNKSCICKECLYLFLEDQEKLI